MKIMKTGKRNLTGKRVVSPRVKYILSNPEFAKELGGKVRQYRENPFKKIYLSSKLTRALIDYETAFNQ